jgi:uncharacterized protein (TIGR00255 family)
VPPSYAGLEARIRSLAQARLSRGRVEISLTVQTRRTPALEVELNETFLEALGGALDHARERGYIAGPMSPGDLLRFPQALAVRERAQEPTADDQLLPRIEEAISAAIDSLDTMRIKEGEFLRADLDARREQLGQLFEQAYAASESGMDALRARLEERVKTLRADALAEETAIAQEIAKFVARSDITEEVVRFRGHLEHWTSLTDAPEPCGRKLDFLLQEMNREVNTVGSKAEGATVSEVVVNLKAELEKMREQVQNVE